MSKFTKLINNPALFLKDAIQKRVGLSGAKKTRPETENSESNRPLIGVYQQLTNFTHNTSVNILKLDDEFVWPYLRPHFLVQLTAVSIGKKSYSQPNRFRLQLGDPDTLDYSTKKEWQSRYDIKFTDEIEPMSDLDFLFVTAVNASEQVEFDGSIYYRIVDPLYEVAKGVGNAMKLEMVRNNSTGVKKIPRYVHKPLSVFAPDIIKSGYWRKMSLDTGFVRKLNRYMPALTIAERDVNAIVDWEFHTRDFYIDLLKRLRPKVVLFSSFHYNAPLISAARSLNIVSVDIQHGIQVGYNPLYNDWEELPAGGYQSLPDHFFVWGKKEANNIKKVFRSPKHTPVVVGNLWIEKQRRMENKLPDALKRKAGGYKHVVLLAMQSQTVIPQIFKDIIDEAPANILWLIRHHPKGARYTPSDFSMTNKNIVISAEVDSAMLVHLLEISDVTLSDGSTVALEGHVCGAEAFITSETGRENYRVEIDEGLFHYIDTKDRFFTVLNSLKQTDERKLEAFASVDVGQVLCGLLKKQ